MPEERFYTLAEIAALLGVHKNTVRNYLKRGVLKAELQDRPNGGQVWVVSEHNLYHSGNAKLNRLLGPQETAARIERQQVAAAAVPDKYLEELLRLARELTAAETELALARDQVPRLQAAAEERDQLVKETARLQAEKDQAERDREHLRQIQAAQMERVVDLETKAAGLERELETARANMSWSARRRAARAARAAQRGPAAGPPPPPPQT